MGHRGHSEFRGRAYGPDPLGRDAQDRTRIAHHFLGGIVQLYRRNARLDHSPQSFPHIGDQLANGSHLVKIFCGFRDDHFLT